MSSTSDREQDDAAASTTPDPAEQPAPTGDAADDAPTPDDAPGTTAPATPQAQAAEAAQATEPETAPGAAPAGASDATPEVVPTGGTGSAARPASTPSRGTSAHRASRPAPVPPAPEERVPTVLPTSPATTPTTATVSDGTGAPTAPLPTTPATGALPTGAAAPATGPVAPAEPVVRTSFRGAEARAAAVLTSGVPGDPGATTSLPGTGPSDASVPYGDQSAPTAPRPAEPVIPGTQDTAEDEAAADPRDARSRRAAGPAPARPEPARRPGGGPARHLLGVLVGLVVGAVGIWTVLFGQSRVLAAQAPGWDASYDVIGVVLVTVGVLVLGLVLGLGLWTPAVPVTAGLVGTVVGVVLLYVPATTHVDVVRWFGTDGTEYSVVRATVTATSGTVFVVGALLLVAGLVLGAARRRWLTRA